jgi:hypothetical protein
VARGDTKHLMDSGPLFSVRLKYFDNIRMMRFMMDGTGREINNLIQVITLIHVLKTPMIC